jgi:hypothetical protein
MAGDIEDILPAIDREIADKEAKEKAGIGKARTIV